MSILDWLFPNNFADDSLELLENLDHAFAWKDPETGRYYTEVEYLQECAYPKGLNNVLRHTHFQHADKEILVIVGRETPDVWLQGKDKKQTTFEHISQPTHFMLQAKQAFNQREEERWRCNYDGCRQDARYQMMGASFKHIGPGGVSSLGRTYHACEEHLNTIKKTADKNSVELRIMEVTEEAKPRW